MASMAKVISLEDRRLRTPRRASKEPVEAKILLFTGVRYERIGIGSHNNNPGAGSKRAR